MPKIKLTEIIDLASYYKADPYQMPPTIVVDALNSIKNLALYKTTLQRFISDELLRTFGSDIVTKMCHNIHFDDETMSIYLKMFSSSRHLYHVWVIANYNWEDQ